MTAAMGTTSNQQLAGYAGDVDVQQAWQALKDDHHAVLVDVRTPAEWEQVGRVDASALYHEPVYLSWLLPPDGEVNPNFIDAFRQAVPEEGRTILLLCKSGGRSQAAARALTQAGYTRCFNVLGGFEGNNGWISMQLPRRQ